MENLLGSQFNTRKDLDSTVKKEAKKYGFDVSIKNSQSDYYVNFQCTRAGKKPAEQVSSNEPIKKRRRTSKRCGCLWSLHATYIKGHDKFIIDEINNKHTGHEVKQSSSTTTSFGGITNLLPTSTSADIKKNFETHKKIIMQSYGIMLKTIIEEHIRANSTIRVQSKTEKSINGAKKGGVEVTGKKTAVENDEKKADVVEEEEEEEEEEERKVFEQAQENDLR